MKHLFLTSNAGNVLSDILPRMKKPADQMHLLFIPTAAELEKGDLHWLDEDRQPLIEAGFQITEFTLTNKTTEQVEKMLDTMDVAFVSGGNSFYLLQQMHAVNFQKIITLRINQGLYYIGSSAGSVVAGPDIEAIKFLDKQEQAPQLRSFRGLELTHTLVLPHWESEHFGPRYIPTMEYINAKKPHLKTIPLRDNQYVEIKGNAEHVRSV